MEQPKQYDEYTELHEKVCRVFLQDHQNTSSVRLNEPGLFCHYPMIKMVDKKRDEQFIPHFFYSDLKQSIGF